jgi:hypothetical protein
MKTLLHQSRWAFAAAVLAAIALSGCVVPSNTPATYDDQVQDNFVSGCTGNFTSQEGVTTTLASNSICQCNYAVFVKSVPYDDTAKTSGTFPGYTGETFLQINDDLKKDPTKFTNTSVIPQNVQDALKQCTTSNGNSTPPIIPSGTSTTTAP